MLKDWTRPDFDPKEYADITRRVVNKLNDFDLGAYFWYQSDWGACYIRFEFDIIPTILIAKGIGNEKHHYTYNIRRDIDYLTIEKAEYGWRYHYPISGENDLVKRVLLDYNNTKNIGK